MRKLVAVCMLFLTGYVSGQQVIIVSPRGDIPEKTVSATVVTDVDKAIEKALASTESDIQILLRAGHYHLSRPLEFSSSQWANKSLLLAPYKQEKVTISGGIPLQLQWEKYKNGIWKSKIACTDFDQLYVNGMPRILARYPNYADNELLNGTAADALSPARIKTWKAPQGGYIHALHDRDWGDMHYVITGKHKGKLTYEGGFQNNRPSQMHASRRFVENIFEELDAPGEWFADKTKGILYYYPLPDEELAQATIEVARLPQLIRIIGTASQPIRNITIQGIHFVQTTRTFMSAYEPLLRSDWMIHRGAALFMEFADNCHILDCELSDLGGNAIFLSRYNIDCSIRGNHIHHIGASAICFVGDTSAVRSPLYRYEQSHSYEELDLTPGPRNNLYPRQCTAEDNLIHDIGRVEKQVAGIQIQVASEIHVRHNTIYSTPRAAINVGDGAFGGHLIEYNDAFRTVLETGDHGTFNSWGRDRFWHPSYEEMSRRVAAHPELILLDARLTTILRNNRFRCDHGWDIDLDDGSSNYHIYNNLCLNGGIKLREGFYRTVENNIVINNSLHPHVWFENSGDIVVRNLFTGAYRPIQVKSWGKTIDYNFFPTEAMLKEAQNRQTDRHSIYGQPIFKNAAAGDFTVLPECKAFEIGFINFAQDRYGVYSPRLKQLARQPQMPVLSWQGNAATQVYTWQNARLRSVKGLGDRSAFGLPDEKGVIVVEVSQQSPLHKSGIQKGDVIRSVNRLATDSVEVLLQVISQTKDKTACEVSYFRDQKLYTTTLSLEK